MARKRKSSGGGRSWLVTRLMRWLGFGSPTVLVMGILGYFGIRAPDLSSFEREPQSAAEVAERWKKVRELWASLNGSAAPAASGAPAGSAGTPGAQNSGTPGAARNPAGPASSSGSQAGASGGYANGGPARQPGNVWNETANYQQYFPDTNEWTWARSAAPPKNVGPSLGSTQSGGAGAKAGGGLAVQPQGKLKEVLERDSFTVGNEHGSVTIKNPLNGFDRKVNDALGKATSNVPQYTPVGRGATLPAPERVATRPPKPREFPDLNNPFR